VIVINVHFYNFLLSKLLVDHSSCVCVCVLMRWRTNKMRSGLINAESVGFPSKGFEGDKRFSVVRALVRALMIALFVIKRNNVHNNIKPTYVYAFSNYHYTVVSGAIERISKSHRSYHVVPIYIWILTHERKQIVVEFNPAASIIYSLCDRNVVV